MSILAKQVKSQRQPLAWKRVQGGWEKRRFYIERFTGAVLSAAKLKNMGMSALLFR